MVTGNLKDFVKLAVDEIENTILIDVTVDCDEIYALKGLHIYSFHRSYASVHLYFTECSLTASWCWCEDKEEEKEVIHGSEEFIYADPKFDMSAVALVVEKSFEAQESVIRAKYPNLKHEASNLAAY